MRRLVVWSALSAGAGLALVRGQDPFWKGLGQQFLGWGIADAGIALGGDWLTRRRRAKAPNPDDSELVRRERSNLRRLLWLNAGLDLLYIWGGWLLARARQRAGDRYGRGHGLGVVVQGGFLALFDLWHATHLPQEGHGP